MLFAVGRFLSVLMPLVVSSSAVAKASDGELFLLTASIRTVAQKMIRIGSHPNAAEQITNLVNADGMQCLDAFRFQTSKDVRKAVLSRLGTESLTLLLQMEIEKLNIYLDLPGSIDSNFSFELLSDIQRAAEVAYWNLEQAALSRETFLSRQEWLMASPKVYTLRRVMRKLGRKPVSRWVGIGELGIAPKDGQVHERVPDPVRERGIREAALKAEKTLIKKLTETSQRAGIGPTARAWSVLRSNCEWWLQR